MSLKTTAHAAEAFRYEPEDLEPHDRSADKAAVGGFIERNKDALNASIEKARVEFERGEYLTLDQVKANLTARRRRLGVSKP